MLRDSGANRVQRRDGLPLLLLTLDHAQPATIAKKVLLIRRLVLMAISQARKALGMFLSAYLAHLDGCAQQLDL